MKSKVNIAFWLFPMALLLHGFVNNTETEFNEIQHSVSIKHPGEEYVVKTTLTEVQNQDGLPVEFYMDVESVICLAKVCKVIPVRLYWNAIGEYQKYTLKEGATLEKYEADLFEPEDYKKIHSILGDSNSPFKEVYIEDIWTVPTTVNEDIDALSGETILELDEKDTVPGAALTCYTLWHWANGDVIDIVKTKTGESVSKEQLNDFIVNGNKEYFGIALKELENRKLYEVPLVSVIVQRVLKEGSLSKDAVVCIENAPTKIYLDAISRLFFEGEKEQKLLAIRSLNTTSIEIPKSYLDKFSEAFAQLESFQEASALLELMQKKNPDSSIVNQNVLPLLDSEFLVARRAYWFLSQQKLLDKQEQKLKDFYNRYKSKL